MGAPVRGMFAREAVQGERIVLDTTILTSGGFSTSADSSSPSTPATSIATSAISLSIPAVVPSPSPVPRNPSFVGVYVRHLLHTHEMSAHGDAESRGGGGFF